MIKENLEDKYGKELQSFFKYENKEFLYNYHNSIIYIDNYLANYFDNKNLKEFFEKTGIDKEDYYLKLGSKIGIIFQNQDDLFDLIKTEEEMGKLTKKVKELIKNYLQLDNVNFLFGTGSSIHLGAASIQNIPSETEKYILDLEDEDLKNDFKSYVEKLQDNMMKKYTPVKDVKFQDDRNWDLIYDGTYIRDYKDIGEVLIFVFLLSLSQKREQVLKI